MAWGVCRAYVCMNTGGVYGTLLIERVSIAFQGMLAGSKTWWYGWRMPGTQGSRDQLGSSGEADTAAAAGQMQEVKKCLWTLTSSIRLWTMGAIKALHPGRMPRAVSVCNTSHSRGAVPIPHPGWSHLLTWAMFRSRFWCRRKHPTFQSYQKL